MTQPLEENRLYSSWSRTPGKLSNSSNFINTKISNISSSTDSGVGQTPNCNSNTDNKFCLYDSSLWSDNRNLQPDLMESHKKFSWDENRNKNQNNFTFGFSSPWLNNNEINSHWNGLSRNNSSDFLGNNDLNKLNTNCWNNSQSIDMVQNEGFLTRNNSIWAANQPDSNISITSSASIDNTNNLNGYQLNDQINKSSKNCKSILPLESDKSEFQLFSAFNSSVAGSEIIPTNDCINKSENVGSKTKGSSEYQTWAQAAGKGLQTLPMIKDDCVKHEVDEQFHCLINRIDGWGSHTVDQSIPWLVDNDNGVDTNNEKASGGSGTNLTSSQRNRSNLESNVWTSEPPNGVGVWESHYENLGERTSRWNSGTAITNQKVKQSLINNSSGVTGGWELGFLNEGNSINTQWTGERDDSWSSNSNITAQKQSWGMLSSIGKPDQALTSPIGTCSRTSVSSNMAATQRNTNAPLPVVPSSSVEPVVNDTVNRHSNLFPSQNMNILSNSNNRFPTGTKSKQLMNTSFRKEDSQNSLYNNNNSIEMSRPFMEMKNSSNNYSNLPNSCTDWNIPPDNFRPNPIEPDNSGVMLSSGYMPQIMIPTNNNQAIKTHMSQNMQMPMGNRMPSENHILLEKQIINEIHQLQSKHQDLVQRINGLRSISGSQAFITEITRTLHEVRQQLNTQNATLKVIRSQMSLVNNNNQMPNGMMNNTTTNSLLSMVPRTLQPSTQCVPLKSQSGMVSDLSVQMNELKLQKNRMDLWFQGNLPSPNTISPYIGTEKHGAFYNPKIPNGGPVPPPQSFNNFNRNSQATNCISSHRQLNQIWQSRMMQNPNCSISSQTNTNSAFNSSIDSSSINNNNGGSTTINNDMGGESISSNSSNSKMQSTSHCSSDLSGNCNSIANSAITAAALSLSQTQPSVIGNRVSSAFSSSRDISNISANISEFVPGQPWPGISYSQRDDPNVTLGAGPRSLLSITNDHLEKLTNSSVNSMNGPIDVANNSTVNNLLPNSLNGVCSGVNRTNMTYVLIRDLPRHINIEMLKNVLTPLNFPGLIHMHPNLASRWVFLHFTSNEEALKAYKNLINKVGVVELLSDQEVNQVIRGHRNNGIIDHPML